MFGKQFYLIKLHCLFWVPDSLQIIICSSQTSLHQHMGAFYLHTHWQERRTTSYVEGKMQPIFSHSPLAHLNPVIFLYTFRLVQQASRKTKKPLLLCLSLQQRCEIWILLMMPVKYLGRLQTKWKQETTPSMKDGTVDWVLDGFCLSREVGGRRGQNLQDLIQTRYGPPSLFLLSGCCLSDVLSQTRVVRGWVAIVSMVTTYVNHMTIQIYGIRLSMKRTEHQGVKTR